MLFALWIREVAAMLIVHKTGVHLSSRTAIANYLHNWRFTPQRPQQRGAYLDGAGHEAGPGNGAEIRPGFAFFQGVLHVVLKQESWTDGARTNGTSSLAWANARGSGSRCQRIAPAALGRATVWLLVQLPPTLTLIDGAVVAIVEQDTNAATIAKLALAFAARGRACKANDQISADTAQASLEAWIADPVASGVRAI